MHRKEISLEMKSAVFLKFIHKNCWEVWQVLDLGDTSTLCRPFFTAHYYSYQYYTHVIHIVYSILDKAKETLVMIDFQTNKSFAAASSLLTSKKGVIFHNHGQARRLMCLFRSRLVVCSTAHIFCWIFVLAHGIRMFLHFGRAAPVARICLTL